MDNRLKTLYPKLTDGSISQEGLDWLKRYFETGNPKELLMLIRAELEATDDTSAETIAEQQTFDRVYNGIIAQRFAADEIQKPVYKLWPRIAGIAAAVAAIAFCIWFYSSPRHLDDSRDLLNYAQDIAPGKNTATLTFNGKSMQLSEAHNGVKVDSDKFTYKDGSPLSPQAEALPQVENSMVTAKTPRGGTYQFILQDGTKVWLNADSKLEFLPDYKSKNQRIVKLEGEGYFEVAKDKTRPFIVETALQRVEVLGTHFNINAYKDEPAIVTTLIEGSVKVSSRNNQSYLKPGFQAINSGADIHVNEADLDKVIDWKEGDFYFQQTDFRLAMRKIARWYDVDVIYDSSIPANLTSNGIIPRNNNLSAVLKSIERSGQVKFKIEGNKILITK